MNYTERSIHISSIDRQKYGISRPDEFTIRFDPPLHLDQNLRHEIAVDRISMTYSWHNITPDYQNQTIKYSNDNGANWHTVTFPNGMYSYSDLNDYLHRVMSNNKHVNDDGTYNINILFILSTYKVIIEISHKDYQLDLRGSNFGDLIGFDKKIIINTENGSRLPNITNSIDVLYVNSDIVTDSIVSGILTNSLFIIPTDNLQRSHPFTIEPIRAQFNPVSSFIVSNIRFYILDSLKRPVNLNGIDWHMNLILRSTPI